MFEPSQIKITTPRTGFKHRRAITREKHMQTQANTARGTKHILKSQWINMKHRWEEPGAEWVSLMYEPSQTTTTRTGLQTRFQTQVRTRVNWKHMQTRAKLCHKIPPTFAGRRFLSATAGQWPISSKQVLHVAEKRVVLDPLTVETDLLHTWKVGLSFLLDARCP